ncbi:MAG: c-type cytochrome [Bryobacterales bacterium]|nr:c-type cytochrome [Bryobacterales bacterium]
MPSRIAVVVLGLVLLTCSRRPVGPPYSPQQSISMLQVADGYRVEPFAAEPDVLSPAAIDIDEDGRIYVAEDRGYPLNVEGKIGRIRLLEDTNGDGTPDRATVFADNLVMPTGVMRWKRGILVTDAPDLLYLEDSNGDGKADIRRKVLTGFPLTNPQHTVNSPVYGLDNWIYLAHENPTTAVIFKDKFGDRGTDISFTEKPSAVLKERGRNIRFRPDSFEIEALAGPSQFGHAFDDFGHHFTLNNTYHARHEVMGGRYLQRNPDLPVAAASEDISDHGMPAKVYPIVPKTRFEMLTNVGEFTSACGLTFWRGGAFVAEPAHNLVHQDIYSPKGATFSARRDRDGVEFIASRDPWFRPVNFYAAPDGSLLLLDYYRLVIEHPEWMATETYGSKDITAGIDRGRIYRIAPANETLNAVRPQLSKATPAELVAHLANSNAWWRRTAQRLLVDRKPAEAVPLLQSMAAQHASPVAKVHALHTLNAFGKLDSALIEKSLHDANPGVRENAILLAEPRLSSDSKLAARLLQLSSDPDPRVRFQLLLTLGDLQTPAAQSARDKLLSTNFGDKWTQIAALSASPTEAVRLLPLAVAQKAPPTFIRNAAAAVGVRHRADEVARLLSLTASGDALEGLATGLRGKKAHLGAPIEQRLFTAFSSPDPNVRRGALHVLEAIELSPATANPSVARAQAVAQDSTAGADLRADSISLLALYNPAARRALLEKLAQPAEPEPVQLAAVRALGRIPGNDISAFLLQGWRAFTPAVRMEAADALYRDPDRLPTVMAALKSGDIQPWALAFRHRSRLVMHRDPALREEARKIFESKGNERAAVIAQYQPALDAQAAKADAQRGREIFENICAKCHKLNGKGADVGPDLATVRNQPKQVLLTAIIDPSQSISQGFEAFVVETTTGGTIDGVLGPQTPTTVTLRHEQGKEDVIQRKDIKSMYVTNLSAMPGDLEKQITVQQMADLLEYLKSAQ